MASTAVTPAQAELISSLTQDEIPIKLRCAHCMKLAVNAFRLPCCDQGICQTCQSTLPDACWVCEHSPVAAEDCKPNKSLRTTIKVFLRTEEKKREALRLKEVKNSPPITPVEQVAVPIEDAAPAALNNEPTSEGQDDNNKEETPSAAQINDASANPENVEEPYQAEQDIPQPSIEEIAPGQESTEDGDADQVDKPSVEGEEQVVQTETNGQLARQHASQTPGFGSGFGFDPSVAGGFPSMGMGGDFSQMQMMMAMQNGMTPNGFGTFPMMGMPGMNMDPMAMQSMQNMMMSGGFGGAMGMNGMNMGIGMAGFDGGVGTGFNNGWNTQQTWNVGQENFNHPNAAGIGHGDYSSSNSGYNSHSAVYNQGNYGQGNQYSNHQANGYGYRGRGRGRGYGRGGYGYGSHDQFSQQFPQQFGSGQGLQSNGPISETVSIPTGPKADAAPLNGGNVDEFGREIRATSEVEDVAGNEAADQSKDDKSPIATVDNGTTENDTVEKSNHTEQLEEIKESSDNVTDSSPKPIQTLDEAQATAYPPNGGYNNHSSRGSYETGFQGRGASFGNMQAPFVKPVDVPINAPTGPKAMRAGLPNTGRSGLIGQGFLTAGRATPNSRVNASASVAPEPTPTEKNGKDMERSKSPSRDRSKSPDRKRSRSRERHSRRHRHRSTSRSEDERESERRRQKRKERRRRYGDDGDGEATSAEKPSTDDIVEDRIEEDRSRSASLSDTKRASHRSRRDKDKYRDRDREDRDKYRERDDDRDHRSSHKHRSSRRHHDDRSRSRDRSRDRDRDHRHRHSRRGSEDANDHSSKLDKINPPAPVEADSSSRHPSVLPSSAVGIEIKGVSSRRKNITVEDINIPTGPRSDRNGNRDRDREKERPGRHREEDDLRHRSSRHRDTDGEREKEREKAKDKERSRPPPTAPAVQDPHTIEREARNRERLLKEAQRIAGLTAGMAGGRKRSNDDGEDASGRNARKKRGRGGDESEEARISRLEAERESARWG